MARRPTIRQIFRYFYDSKVEGEVLAGKYATEIRERTRGVPEDEIERTITSCLLDAGFDPTEAALHAQNLVEGKTLPIPVLPPPAGTVVVHSDPWFRPALAALGVLLVLVLFSQGWEWWRERKHDEKTMQPVMEKLAGLDQSLTGLNSAITKLQNNLDPRTALHGRPATAGDALNHLLTFCQKTIGPDKPVGNLREVERRLGQLETGLGDIKRGMKTLLTEEAARQLASRVNRHTTEEIVAAKTRVIVRPKEGGRR